MAKIKVVQNSLVSGVINETAWGRTDIAKFYSGVAEANNMIVQTTGGMFKRPGFEFIDTTLATKKEYELNFEIDGQIKDLLSKYNAILAEKVKALGLAEDKLYAIDDWAQELLVYNKKEKEINENTTLESFSDAKLITRGEPLF